MVERLREWARDESLDRDPSVCVKAARALDDLHWYIDSTPILQALVKDRRVIECVRREAIQILGRPRRANTLTESRYMARRRPLPPTARTRRNGARTRPTAVVDELPTETFVDAQEDVLFQFATGQALEPAFRMEAARYLNALDKRNPGRASEAWVSLVKQPDQPIANRIKAAEELCQYDREQAKVVLLSIGWNYTSGNIQRLEAAKTLERLGWKDEARALYIALIRRGVSKQVQKQASQRLKAT
jgi:hypothetical protein